MPKNNKTIRKPNISCKRKYGMKTCRIKRRRRIRSSRRARYSKS